MKKNIVMLITCFILVTVLAADTATKYAIGDKGLGGGLIFYRDGSTYYECSENLGKADWEEATQMGIDYRGGDYDDWYLPNKEELNYIYENLVVKGFIEASGWFWSSSDYVNNFAVFQFFDYGYQYFDYKAYDLDVCVIRSFTL